MQRRRTRGMLCLAAVTLFAVTACSGTSDAATYAPSVSQFAGTPTGKLQVSGFSQGDEIASERVKYTTDQMNQVDINVPDGSFDEQVFLSSVVAHTPPDVVYLDSSQVGEYAARGALEQMDNCYTGQHINKSDYRPELINAMTYNGHIYGVPEFYNTPVIIVNNTLLQEAGLTLADVSLADQDKLMKLATSMTKHDKNGKITQLGVALRVPELMPLYGYIDDAPWVRSSTDIRLDDPATIATFKRIKQVEDAQGGQAAIEDATTAWDYWGSDNPIATNKIGVQVIEQWYVNVLAQESPDANFTVLPILDKNGQPITQATGSAWAIPKGAKNPRAACAWAKDMTSVPAWTQASQTRIDLRKKAGQEYTGTYTGNVKADDVIFNQLYQPAPSEKKFSDAVYTTLDLQKYAKVDPATPVGAQYETAWQEATNAYLKGSESAEAALKEAQTKVDSAYADLPNNVANQPSGSQGAQK